MVGTACVRGAPEIEEESGRHNACVCGARDGGGEWSQKRVRVCARAWGTRNGEGSGDLESARILKSLEVSGSC